MTTHTTPRHDAHADLRCGRCRDEHDRCAGCRARAEEARAARRDAVLHRLATVRPRRALL